jgi:aminoglycoside phosphotransferase family enzyme
MNDEKTSLKEWLAMVEKLRYAPQWASEEPVPVEMVQTHISVVLLGRERVLKLKKPVNFGFLDYSTLEQRRIACEAEVTLNRRLCEHTYLGVQPIGQVEGLPQLSDAGQHTECGGGSARRRYGEFDPPPRQAVASIPGCLSRTSIG